MNRTAERPALRYGCACHRAFQVFGGRRRTTAATSSADVGCEDPLMARVCPACQPRLPGKNLR